MNKKVFKIAKATLEMKKEGAIRCAEEYGTCVSMLAIHDLNGYIECLLDMHIISCNGYLLLSKWVRELENYLDDNYKCRVK